MTDVCSQPPKLKCYARPRRPHTSAARSPRYARRYDPLRPNTTGRRFMIPLPHDSSDDPAFIEIARNAIAGDAARYVARFVHVVKLDAWFGDRWFGFSGKALGALGVHWPR